MHRHTLQIEFYVEDDMPPEQVGWAINEWLMEQNTLPAWCDSAIVTAWHGPETLADWKRL